MPAYSRFLADYTTPFVTQSWHPEAFSTGRGIRGGSIAIGMGFGANLWPEFWPDVRKSVKILDRFKDSSVASAVPPVAPAPVP
jgi:hypothetical protein